MQTCHDVPAQEVRKLVDDEAVRCIFIQDNPAYDCLRSSLGLRRSAFSLKDTRTQAGF